MKATYEKPTVRIKKYSVQTTINVSPVNQQVYDAGVTNGTVQYTLGTLNS